VSFKFKCNTEQSNANRFYEIDFVDDPRDGGINCILLIKHVSLGVSDEEFEQYMVGTKKDVLAELAIHVHRRRKHGYVPENAAAKNLAEGYGWTDWETSSEDEDTDAPANP